MGEGAEKPVQFWESVKGSGLAQGDYLLKCDFPVVSGTPDFSKSDEFKFRRGCADLIIITQSCDMAIRKVGGAAKSPWVSLSPIWSVRDYKAEKEQALRNEFKPVLSEKRWASFFNEIRDGKRFGLHLLGSATNPPDPWSGFVVDFKQIYTLPFEYVATHAGRQEERFRLNPPFLEHFSQAFARFFMRVGLPTEMPRFEVEKKLDHS